MLQLIYYIVFGFSLTYALYFLLTGFFGFKKMKQSLIGHHKPKHKLAVLIASRNEESVIGSLVKSLVNQDYPKDLYDIYVIPNNCTDDTKGAAKAAGAKIINCTVPVKSKGDVLHFVFNKMKNDPIDAYIIFDADNVVESNYLSRMNDALCEGYRAAQGFRDSKNASDNWLSGSYSIFYWVQNFFFNKSRMQMSGSASINGTGFMVKKDVIDEFGFKTISLTEDVEFTAQCALNQVKIVFVEDAITYDEQPVEFITSWKQRKRWSTGMLQCLSTYSGKLYNTYRRTRFISCLDMALVFLAPIMQIIGLMLTLVLILFKVFNIELFDVFAYFFAYGFVFFLISYVINILINIFVIKYNGKKVKDTLSGVFLFSFFIITWIPINIICLFKRNVTWEPIKHSRNIDISEIKK